MIDADVYQLQEVLQLIFSCFFVSWQHCTPAFEISQTFVSVQRTRAHVTVDKVRVCLTRFEESSACVTMNPTKSLMELVQVSVFRKLRKL